MNAYAASPQQGRSCARCALPDRVPGADLDEDGVCRYCRQYEAEAVGGQIADQLRRFLGLVQTAGKGEGGYDAVLAFSGGKDSSFSLYLLTRTFGLRTLAVCVDNGFLSPQARENIHQVTGSLGVDLVMHRPDPRLMRALFRAAAHGGMFPPATLRRASEICSACIGVVKGLVLRTALERRVRFVAWGWSPGQAPIRASILRYTEGFLRKSAEGLLAPLVQVAGPGVRGWFPDPDRLPGDDDLFWQVHPLAFFSYAEEDILRAVRRLGWRRPTDTDGNSSNCLLNSLGNRLHLERHGFHPYSLEVSGLVRAGCLSLEQGRDRLSGAGSDKVADRVRREILGEIEPGGRETGIA